MKPGDALILHPELLHCEEVDKLARKTRVILEFGVIQK
jgi:hypothetical protein